ncbi:MAG: heparinase II/III family protein, partial [Armatimonadota bacterium]|nr:heparinase II/III family protein [Armatimonadota bacterium]
MLGRLVLAVMCLAVVVALPHPCEAQVEPRVLSSCDDPTEWTAGTVDRENVKEGKASLLWEHGKTDSVALKKVPADWTAYDRLSFWIHSRKATGTSFMVIISSENPATEGIDYYSARVTLNFTGWKHFRYYLPTMPAVREPLGWNQIQGVRFTASGWTNTPHPEAVVSIDALVLTHEGKETGPRMTDKDLFEALDLTRPGLEAVAAAYRRGDLAGAKAALATYYRRRQNPRWYFPAGEKANPKPANPSLDRAERVLQHEMQSIGIRHKFGPVIDWYFDKTTEPGSNLAPNNEWTWQLNRHADWIALADAYRDTGDEKYAREWVAQMTQWVRDCPMPDDAGNGPRSPWRTIETGIRAAGVWPHLFYRFLLSPEFTDEALVTMLKGFADHARHLMEHHTSGNWLAMEGNGLFHVGVLFPEFKDAPAWRKTGIGWLYDEMNNQVYPDGVQIELSSGYHHVSLGNFLEAYRIARLNDVPLPDDYLKRLQKMYEFDVYGAMPDRRLPGVQDGNYMSVVRALREASELFPERQDYRWYATNGNEGAPPAETSHAFPYAGYFVMRSGWEPDARWLLFDGGPFGYAHQHEDKLNLIVHAFGKLLLVDPGNYQYERSKWRSYFVDSPAHNVVLVDGQPQRRRNRPSSSYVVKEPLPHVWETTPAHD